MDKVSSNNQTVKTAPEEKSAFKRFARALFVEFWGLKLFSLLAGIFIWLAITLR